jgi:hypothetical protein
VGGWQWVLIRRGIGKRGSTTVAAAPVHAPYCAADAKGVCASRQATTPAVRSSASMRLWDSQSLGRLSVWRKCVGHLDTCCGRGEAGRDGRRPRGSGRWAEGYRAA